MLLHVLIISTLHAYTVLLLLYVQLIHRLVARLPLVCCILRVYIILMQKMLQLDSLNVYNTFTWKTYLAGN